MTSTERMVAVIVRWTCQRGVSSDPVAFSFQAVCAGLAVLRRDVPVTVGGSDPSPRDTLQKALLSGLLGLWVGSVVWQLARMHQESWGTSLGLALAGFALIFSVYQAFGPSIHPARFSRGPAVSTCLVLVALIATTLTWPAVLRVAGIGDGKDLIETPQCVEEPYEAADWGPDRPIEPNQSTVPAFVTELDFDNSIDNRAWLVGARDAAYQDSPPPNGGYQHSIDIDEQSSYRIRLMFGNNGYQRPGMEINDVRMFVRLPRCSSTDVRLVGSVVGDNATPNRIWGTVHFHAARPFKLAVEPDAGPGHRNVVCWPSSSGCHPNGVGFSSLDPNLLVGSEGLAIPGGTLAGQAGVFLLLYVRPVFD